jgi:hypothetical protein
MTLVCAGARTLPVQSGAQTRGPRRGPIAGDPSDEPKKNLGKRAPSWNLTRFDKFWRRTALEIAGQKIWRSKFLFGGIGGYQRIKAEKIL